MTHEPQPLSREEVARIEIGQTQIQRRHAAGLTVAFLLLVSWVAPLQMLLDLRGGEPVHAFALRSGLRQTPAAYREAGGSWLDRVFAANRFLLGEMHAYEDRLEKGSFLEAMLVPPLQYHFARTTGLGNEQAYLGRDGWLFYRPGVDYVTGPGFLDPRVLKRRALGGHEWQAATQPDPIPAILQFRDQLAARGIRLVLVPVPVKPVLHPEKLARGMDPVVRPLHNASYPDFMRAMEEAGIVVFDTAPLLAMTVLSEFPDRYLKTDTHWLPESMDLVAEGLADVVRIVGRLGEGRAGYGEEETTVTALGDIAQMLRLPASQTLYPPESVTVRRVVDAEGVVWKADPLADVLLLGDSFSNIYSDERMGWGGSAGLAERLSFHLRRPVDAILRNDAGAHATRRMLSQQMLGGVDRLAGKKVVVWQFAARELAVGDWPLTDLTVGPAERSAAKGFVVLEPGVELLAEGQVAEATPVPTPGSVPYKDHIRTLHLVNLRSADGTLAGDQAVVYVWSMRDNRWTPAAGLSAGDRVTLRLKSWNAVADELGAVNRSELGDVDLQLQEPCWGEWP